MMNNIKFRIINKEKYRRNVKNYLLNYQLIEKLVKFVNY